MYQNRMYDIFNQNYVQEQQREWNMQMNMQRHHNEQMCNVIECVQKLDDFMKSAKKVSPEYQGVAIGLCCTKIDEHMSKNKR